MAGVDRRCQSVASPLDAGLRRGCGSFRGAPARGPFRYPRPARRVAPGYPALPAGLPRVPSSCPRGRSTYPALPVGSTLVTFPSHPSPAHPACGVAPGIPVLPTGSPRVPSLYLAGSPQIRPCPACGVASGYSPLAVIALGVTPDYSSLSPTHRPARGVARVPPPSLLAPWGGCENLVWQSAREIRGVGETT